MQKIGATVNLSAGDLVGHLNCRYLTELDLKVANVPAKSKTDKTGHHQDGSGYHHPVRIFHLGESHFPFGQPPADADLRVAFSFASATDCRGLLFTETPSRIAILRMASGDRFMRFAISSAGLECFASSSKRRSPC